MIATEFKKAIKVLSSAANKNGKRTVVYNRIFVSNSELYVIMNDKYFNCWTRISYPVTINIPGSYCVDAKQFAAAVTALNDTDIVLSIRDNNLFINEKIKLICEESDGLQNVLPTEDAKNISVPSSFGKDMKDVSTFAASDYLHLAMCGVFFDGSNSDTLVASDGHILISRALGSTSSGVNVLFPVSFASICPNVDSFLRWEYKCETYVSMSADGLNYTVLCADQMHRFPNWRLVIPDKKDDTKTFEKKEFLNFLNMAKKIKYNNILLCFLGSLLKLVCYDTDNNTNDQNLSCSDCGSDISIVGYRTDLWLKILKVLTGNVVNICRFSYKAPTLINDNNTDLLIMPICVNSDFLEEQKSKFQKECINIKPSAVTAAPSPEAIATPGTGVPSSEAMAAPVTAVPSPEAIAAPVTAVPSPEAIAAPVTAVPSPEAMAAPVTAVPSQEPVEHNSLPVKSPMESPKNHGFSENDYDKYGYDSGEKIFHQATEFSRLIKLLRLNVEKGHSETTVKKNLKKFSNLVHDEFFRRVTVFHHSKKNGCPKVNNDTVKEFYRRCSVLETGSNLAETLKMFSKYGDIYTTCMVIEAMNECKEPSPDPVVPDSASVPVPSPEAPAPPTHHPIIAPMEFRKHHRFFETIFKIFIFAALRKRSEFERFLPVLLFLVYIVFRTAAPSRAPRRLFRPPVLAPEPGGIPDILYIEPMEFRKHHRFFRARFKNSNFRLRHKISDKRGFISVFGDKFPFSVDKSPCVYDFTPEKPP